MYDIERLKNSFKNDELFVGSRNQIEQLLQYVIDNHPEVKFDEYLTNTSNAHQITTEVIPYFQEAYDISGKIGVRFIYDELHVGPPYAMGFDTKSISEIGV